MTTSVQLADLLSQLRLLHHFQETINHQREKLAEKGVSQDWSGVDLQRCIGHMIVTLFDL